MELPNPTAGDQMAAVLGAVVLVAANALFVMAEYALVRVRPARLQQLAEDGSFRARTALRLVERIDESISICQVGVTLCGLALGYLGEPAFARLIGPVLRWLLSPAAAFIGPLTHTISLVVSFLLVTFLLVVLGELIPKRVTIAFTERILLGTALPIRLFGLIAWPLVALLNGSARVLLRAMHFRERPPEGHTREEILQLLAMSARSGGMDTVEARLLENLFRFSRRRARDAMVPRGRVIVLDVRHPVERLLALARNEGYSRYPLVEGDLDHAIGIVLVRELFAMGPNPGRDDVRRLARAPVIVPNNLALDRLLRRFQHERAHLALVADEYGAVVGIVTLEDVLEELVGELRDEFDVEEQDPVRPLPGGGYILDPGLAVDRATELVPDPPELPEGVHTLAGLIQAELGRIPAAGERIPFGAAHQLVATVVQGTRILRVELLPNR